MAIEFMQEMLTDCCAAPFYEETEDHSVDGLWWARCYSCGELAQLVPVGDTDDY